MIQKESQDFYKILGVDRSASQATIRAAYVAALKQVHPDTARNSDDARAKAITEAISILRDPRKRALYDLQLISVRRKHGPSQQGSGALEQGRSSLGPPLDSPPRAAPGRIRGISSALLLLSLLAAALALLVEPSSSPRRNLTTLEGGSAYKDATSTIRPMDVGDSISDLNWILGYGEIDDATRYSAHCFQQLLANPSLAMFDRCVAFDFAAYHHLPGGEDVLSASYFNRESMSSRHVLTIDARGVRLPLTHRVAAIEQMVISQLADARR